MNVQAVDLNEVPVGKLIKRMFSKRNLGDVYTLCMRISRKKHQGELYFMKLRGKSIFNRNKTTNCVVLYNKVKDGGTNRKKLD